MEEGEAEGDGEQAEGEVRGEVGEGEAWLVVAEELEGLGAEGGEGGEGAEEAGQQDELEGVGEGAALEPAEGGADDGAAEDVDAQCASGEGAAEMSLNPGGEAPAAEGAEAAADGDAGRLLQDAQRVAHEILRGGWVVASIVGVAVGLATATARGDSDDAEVPVYRLAMLNQAPYLELELGSAQGWFLLDTGANDSGVDAGWVQAEGIPHQVTGSSGVGGTTGTLRVSEATFGRLQLGNGFFLEPEFNLQDFSGFRSPEEGPQVGLLGTDFLNRYQLSLDYEAATAELRLEGERESLGRGWVPVTVTYPNRLPTVWVRVGGLDVPCRLDSGASYLDGDLRLDVNRATVRALRAAGVELEECGSLTVRGVSGSERLPLLRSLEGLELEVGPWRGRDVVLVVHGRGTFSGPDPMALASASVMGAWERFVLDPFDHLLWLPGRRRR